MFIDLPTVYFQDDTQDIDFIFIKKKKIKTLQPIGLYKMFLKLYINNYLKTGFS